ncbi:MAG: Undecaprenyl-phosphate alpha-N-acetylglucosaminyl 1-phosphate transferase [uncultured Thermomicrobiales bacterium]|uniref:Undecaprenyl-phosphate alpha-N-acetylglucosaminyl 1-phosphate transferase n=1 Tax=uncultured Thermomicrobiales bacterium TaxID=1645740 RepID=A0A6J4UCI7_9BACT|nr:MAG: Undecaprenyl-phosphate alpha-N-acetylglucosaminyl 1-phosphate transferase [uncultured Thermomicrobiales bacterium]
MSHALTAAVVFITTAAVSSLLVSKAIVLSRHLGLVDRPGPRRAHQVPMPRGGGLAIYLAFAVGVALTFSLDVERIGTETERLLLLLAAGGMLAGTMVYDDALGLSPRVKLAWQFGAAALVVMPRLRGAGHGIVIEQFNAPVGGDVVVLPLAVALAFTVFWIVGMANALNLVDGLDGLAATVTLVACAVLFAHTYFRPEGDPQFTISLLPLALGGAVVGFLRYNWHPAKIIMGDSGAYFLGFALAVIAIIGGAKIATASLALGLPILDVAWLIAYRSFHGRSPVSADRGHLHHRLVDAGLSPAQVAAYVGGISAVFGGLALVLPSRELKLVALALTGVVLLGTVAVLAWRDRRRGGQGAAVRPGIVGPPK